jgi:hypothetical protein
MSSNFSRIVVFAAALAGCTRLSQLREPQAVTLNTAYPENQAKLPAKVGSATWMFDQKQLTDTAIVMLGRAMEKHGVTVAPQAGKTLALRVRVLGVRLRVFGPVAQTTARLGLDARFGDGTGTYIEADNASPAGAQRAYDGAVLFALNQLLADEKFLAYMNR